MGENAARSFNAKISSVDATHEASSVDSTGTESATLRDGAETLSVDSKESDAAGSTSVVVPEVVARSTGWASRRGLGDIRVQRDVLEASPHQHTSEMLSAAPGFFVDHEDGEGLGNDVYLRGFDLNHGSGIEMRLGSVPINNPVHTQGQGYADANFIIPEVVRSIRVLEGPFDPRQGDAAIVGSAYFDLGVVERGYRVGGTYGSFGQARIVGIAAPHQADEDSFAAFSLRRTGGFGANRAGQSASGNVQYGVDLGPRDHLKIVATAYGGRSAFAGVVRQDDVDAKRIGFYDTYPYQAEGQGVTSSRVIVAQELEHREPSGARMALTSWFMWTAFANRQNFGGNVEVSHIDPRRFGEGDLFETTNREAAAGITSFARTAPVLLGEHVAAVAEPGIYLRAGHTDQAKNLLVPHDLSVWDRRLDSSVYTLDVGAYVDLDLRLWKRLRIAGGPRADLLTMSISDRLAGVIDSGTAPNSREGIAPGVRATAEYEIAPWLAPVFSFGEGFRSLDAQRLPPGSSQPFSGVRSIEAGVRVLLPDERFVTRVSAFETRVDNELVFEATSGGLERQNESVRRGVVGSLIAKPVEGVLASTAISVSDAVFATRIAGISHHVPNVPTVLLRTDVTLRGRAATWQARPVIARTGVGYTLLAGRHLTDKIVSDADHILNANAALRWDAFEVGVEVYNALGLRYADDQQVYVSNWSLRPGQQPASLATHIVAAPPRAVVATVTAYF